jgi:aldose sugar dehydrogenase
MGRVPETAENASRCICGGCPSYPRAGSFFCATGKSDQPVRERGCICGDCPIYGEFRLGDSYYCIHGAASDSAE